MNTGLMQITGGDPAFSAGVEFAEDTGRIIRAAPILNKICGYKAIRWNARRLAKWVTARGWTVALVERAEL